MIVQALGISPDDTLTTEMLERALKDAVSKHFVSLSRISQRRLCLKCLTLCREYLNTTYFAHT